MYYTCSYSSETIILSEDKTFYLQSKIIELSFVKIVIYTLLVLDVKHELIE